jgi:hypothetical protein
MSAGGMHHLFALHEVLSEYAKSILVHMENSSEENKRQWTMRKSILTHSPCTLKST